MEHFIPCHLDSLSLPTLTSSILQIAPTVLDPWQNSLAAIREVFCSESIPKSCEAYKRPWSNNISPGRSMCLEFSDWSMLSNG